MILADTSVWIDHMRRREPELVRQLQTGSIVRHPMVLGELACGNIGNRSEHLRDWGLLPRLEGSAHEEVLSLIESRQFMGRGMGFVDMHLLCAALGYGVQLWTRDGRLRAASIECGVAFTETV